MKRIIAISFLLMLSTAAWAQFFNVRFKEVPVSASPSSRQGGVALDGCIFQFFDGAPAIDVYSLDSSAHLQRIPLEGHRTWHCNNACLSEKRFVKGDAFPLIYVSQENKSEHCICVFRISGSKGSYNADVIQRIILPEPVQMGVWYPNLALDNDGGFIYVTGYSRESWNDPRRGNGLQIIKFKLPSLFQETVILQPSDILDRRVYDFRLATQGAVIRDGRLYQVYGMAGDSSIVCYDLSTGRELWVRDLASAGIPNEPESLFFYNDELICVDVRGIVYTATP